MGKKRNKIYLVYMNGVFEGVGTLVKAEQLVKKLKKETANRAVGKYDEFFKSHIVIKKQPA